MRLDKGQSYTTRDIPGIQLSSERAEEFDHIGVAIGKTGMYGCNLVWYTFR